MNLQMLYYKVKLISEGCTLFPLIMFKSVSYNMKHLHLMLILTLKH